MIVFSCNKDPSWWRVCYKAETKQQEAIAPTRGFAYIVFLWVCVGISWGRMTKVTKEEVYAAWDEGHYREAGQLTRDLIDQEGLGHLGVAGVLMEMVRTKQLHELPNIAKILNMGWES